MFMSTWEIKRALEKCHEQEGQEIDSTNSMKPFDRIKETAKPEMDRKLIETLEFLQGVALGGSEDTLFFVFI